jgi:hypothetical protein
MGNASTTKKPTLKSLAAEMRRLRERLEDMEDLLALRAAVERNAGKPGVPWEQVKAELGWISLLEFWRDDPPCPKLLSPCCEWPNPFKPPKIGDGTKPRPSRVAVRPGAGGGRIPWRIRPCSCARMKSHRTRVTWESGSGVRHRTRVTWESGSGVR